MAVVHVLSRRALSTVAALSMVRGSTIAMSRVIDSAVHVWSDGAPPYPWANAPPKALASAATPEALMTAARGAGVTGALIVQPANHMYDHSYVTAALKAHPDFFRGMGLANPTLPAAEAVASLEALHAAGYVGVRFNAGAFEGGLQSDVSRALYKRAGELGMPVGVMAFKGIGPFLPSLRALCDEFPATPLVIDHMGFVRQPAIGGQLGDAATNDEAAWAGLLALATYPQVYVKVSALFRASGAAPPFLDLQPRVGDLLRSYGASRLMWGSDFPFALPGGFPLPDGVEATPAALSYAEAVAVPGQWSVEGLDAAAREALMGGTAAKLFRFGREAERSEL